MRNGATLSVSFSFEEEFMRHQTRDTDNQVILFAENDRLFYWRRTSGTRIFLETDKRLRSWKLIGINLTLELPTMYQNDRFLISLMKILYILTTVYC